MAGRWTLDRAGITNVYQYGEETLHFGGGRLLLRGVNGSGKSTAMNMLLPFLLEARTARIDAAGEQTGVLRSWMLSGRDETQPVGYLWIEFVRGNDHLTCGCGIKANAKTDRVSTWWFVTERRPGIDLALVEGRQPLSVDALRETLEPGAVFAEKDRPAYRAEVRKRLFGGADLDQHLRLLHVVRSPRVGDRIDVDLPRYLSEALPQLSEEALDDAAQPLEDLEEHRRNVEELRRTSTALDAMAAVYGNYVRSDLHRRADDAGALVRSSRSSATAAAQAETEVTTAETEEQAATTAVAGLEQDERRLDGEIRDLEASEAFKSGAELDHLRDLVKTLETQVGDATRDLSDRRKATERSLTAVNSARQETNDAHGAVREGLGEVAGLAAEVGLTARPPDVPEIDVMTLGTTGARDARGAELADGAERADDLEAAEAVEAEGSSRGGAGQPVRAPAAELDADVLVAGVGRVRSGIRQREAEVAELGHALDRVDRAEEAHRSNTTRVEDATTDAGEAEETFGAARRRLDAAALDWLAALTAWTEDLTEHHQRHGIAAPGDGTDDEPVGEADVVDRHGAIVERAQRDAQAAVDHHGALLAEQRARRTRRMEELAEAEKVVAELLGRELPDPPATPWQRSDRAIALADLVDFAPDVSVEDRTGLEAAMLASGLLGAEVAADAAAELQIGELSAHPGTAAGRSLADVLVVTVPEDLAATVSAATVSEVLATVSVESDDLDATDDRTVVTADGRFRTGMLRGRHEVGEAEHIGVTARRAALERQRAEAARQVGLIQVALDGVRAEITSTERFMAEATELRTTVPSTTELVAAVAASTQAEGDLEQKRTRLAVRREALTEADRLLGEALDATRRQAATLGLPHDRAGLDRVSSSLGRVSGACSQADRAVTGLARAVSRWRQRAEEWVLARDQEAVAQGSLQRKRNDREREASKLGTLEDAIGLEYRQVVEAIETSRRDLAAARSSLGGARDRSRAATGARAAAGERRREAVDRQRETDRRCIAVLPALRRALEVPGVLAAVAPEAEAVEQPPGEDEAEATRGDDGDGPADTGGPTHVGPGDSGTSGAAAGPTAAPLPVVEESVDGVRELVDALTTLAGPRASTPTNAEGVRQSLRQRRDSLGAGWDAEDHQPDDTLPLHVEVNGPEGRMALPAATAHVGIQLRRMAGLLSTQQDQALRNLLQGLVAKEVAEKLHAAGELVGRMNARLGTITTSHGIAVSLRWKRRSELDADLDTTIGLLAKLPDLRSAEEDQQLSEALSTRIAEARAEEPERPYRDLIAHVLDYRDWHEMALILHRPGRGPERLTRRTALSEGEKKMASYLPLFAAVAASCDALADRAADAPRFVLLDDAFAKVSEDNHAKLFGLLVELDLDFIATSERLWGTHATVPELAITEVIRDADLGAIVLEHSRWNGAERSPA